MPVNPATDPRTVGILKDLLALGAGALSVPAFAPFHLSALAPITLWLLFLTLRGATTGRAALRGYLYGLGQFGAGAHWVYISMHDYSGASVIEACGLTLLFVAGFALYAALAGYLASRVSRRLPDSMWAVLLAYPACWVGVEWFRGWFLTGFPWLQLGYSQIDNVLGQGLAPIGGVYAVSLAVALMAGCLQVATEKRNGRVARLAALSAIPLMFSLAYPLSRIQWGEALGQPISVALLQGNVSQDLKWQPETRPSTMAAYRDLTRSNWDVKLIVWPETAIPAFLHQVWDDYLAALQTEAVQHGVDVLIGAPVMDQQTRRYYNGLVSLTPGSGAYYKRHMVPFGEYLPLRPLLGFVLELLQIPLADFEPGLPSQTPIRAAGFPLAATICFEDVFGYEARKGLPEAAYLVNVTNDAWFGHSIEPYQHLQMAQMRALETGRYLLRATNTGITAIIAPTGQVIDQLPMFRQGALRGQIQPMKGATPYVLFGEIPVVGLLGIMTLLGLHKSRKTPDR